MLNVVAASMYYVAAIMCHPTFKSLGALEGVPVGTQTYCFVAAPSLTEKREHATQEACEAALKEFMKPEDMGDLENNAMSSEGFLVGVCHKAPEGFPYALGEEGVSARMELIQRYGPKGDGV